MNKLTKILIKVLGAIIVLGLLFFFVIGPIMKNVTKKNSPEVIETYTNTELDLEIFYCSPAKKDRNIFGELVPYGEVWRTGANEASTFKTNKDLVIDGKNLPAGAYSLWTIPNATSWEVIFNKKMYGWGVKVTDQKAAREPEYDALITTAAVSKSMTSQENFTIKLVEGEENAIVMIFSWDNVVVPVRMTTK